MAWAEYNFKESMAVSRFVLSPPREESTLFLNLDLEGGGKKRKKKTYTKPKPPGLVGMAQCCCVCNLTGKPSSLKQQAAVARSSSKLGRSSPQYRSTTGFPGRPRARGNLRLFLLACAVKSEGIGSLPLKGSRILGCWMSWA